MEINSSLLQFNEYCAVCSVTLKVETKSVTLYATGLASESERHVDLAQARALILARQVLEEGLTSVTVEEFLSTSRPKGSSERITEPAAPATISPTTTELTLPDPVVSQQEPAPRAIDENKSAQTPTPAEPPATTMSETPVEVDTDDVDKIVLDIPW